MADDKTVDQVTEEMEELSFDPTMKKKKPSSRKKSVAFEDPSTADLSVETPTPEPGIHSLAKLTAEAEEDLFSGKKKKAKKILVNADDAAEEPAEEPAEEGDDLDFSSLKKKKKRVTDEQIAALDAQLEEAGIVDEKDIEIEGEDPFVEGAEEKPISDEKEEEGWLNSDRDYTYDEVLPLYMMSNSSFYTEYSVSSAKITHPSVSERKSPYHPPSSSAKAPNEPSSQTSTINLSDSIVH
jgi:hypothetical protein